METFTIRQKFSVAELCLLCYSTCGSAAILIGKMQEFAWKRRDERVLFYIIRLTSTPVKSNIADYNHDQKET